MNIGQLIASLGVDASGLDMAMLRMEQFGKKSQAVTAASAASWSRLGGQMYTFGIRWSMYVTAPIIAMGAAAFKTASEFEASMQKIVGLVGESQGQVTAWSAEILKLGPELGQMPKELAKAMYFITSSGFSGAEAFDILRQSAKAASAGLGDVQSVADAVTSAMSTYRAENLQASRALDIFTAAIREGKIEASGFNREIGTVMSLAAKLGVGLEEVSAAMASMSLQGINAAHSATYLRGIFNAMIKPDEGAIKAFDRLGTSAEELRNILERDLLGALKKIYDLTRTEKNVEIIGEVFPDIRGMLGFLTLVGQNYEKNAEIFREVYSSTGDMNQAFLAMTDTMQYQKNKALAELQAAWIKMGESMKEYVIPMLQSVAKTMKFVGDRFSQMSGAARSSIIGFVLFSVALGPISLTLSFFAKFVIPAAIAAFGYLRSAVLALNAATMANPFIMIIGAVTLLSAALITLSNNYNVARKAKIRFELEEINKNNTLMKGFIEKNEAVIAGWESVYAQMVAYHKASLKKETSYDTERLMILSNNIRQQISLEQELTDVMDDNIKRRISNDKNIQNQQKLIDAKEAQLRAAGMELKDRMEVLQPYIAARQAMESKITNDIKAAYSKRIEILEGYYKEIDGLINKNQQGEIIDFTVSDIMDEVKVGEEAISRLAKVLGWMPEKYKTAEEYQSLYMQGLDKLSREKSPAAQAAMEILSAKLQALGITGEKDLKKITKVMDELNSKLVYAGALKEINGGEDVGQFSQLDYLKENLSSYQSALKELAGLTPEADDWLTYSLALYSVRKGIEDMGKALTTADIKQKLADIGVEEERIAKIEALLGTRYNSNTELVQLYDNALKNMGATTALSVDEKNKLLVKLDEATDAMEREARIQDIYNTIASASVDVFRQMGAAIGGQENAWESLADTVLSAVSAIIAAVLAEMLIKVMNKEIESKGWVLGLVAATIAVGAITAAWEGYKSDAKSAARLAKGGKIPAGYPNDTYPAMLTSGETVLPPGELPQSRVVVVEGGKMVLEGYTAYWQLKAYEKHLAKTT
jgi:TP901 family phage tail tape measure protein